MRNKEKIFLLPLREWPLFPVFWGVFFLGKFLAAFVIGSICRLFAEIINIQTVEAGILFSNVQFFFYTYYIFVALYAVYLTRHNLSKTQQARYIPTLVLLFIPFYLLVHFTGGFFLLFSRGTLTTCLFGRCSHFILF